MSQRALASGGEAQAGPALRLGQWLARTLMGPRGRSLASGAAIVALVAASGFAVAQLGPATLRGVERPAAGGAAQQLLDQTLTTARNGAEAARSALGPPADAAIAAAPAAG
ncbi:MAG: hypothetical protein LBT54_06555, partial [Bifidobacteriaceae bacterium]|nr:hypothetical protein [Bifidobacteriaceae bacterium]